MNLPSIASGQTDGVAYALVAPGTAYAGHLVQLDELGDQGRALLEAARTTHTHLAHRADWQHFAGWCADRELSPCWRPRAHGC